ncbi:hypothetical protein [Paenibacillus sp. sptzw28]|uniref:hypothetical protein n=1 Tax=Paenibacillus sp. sptzw28 TaxID=715179 RepID=UPI002162AD3E|nr:hypothetical protein [Paenibacillus sp. sptzw28]
MLLNQSSTGKLKKNEGISIGFESLSGQDRINSVGGAIYGPIRSGSPRWRTPVKSFARTVSASYRPTMPVM